MTSLKKIALYKNLFLILIFFVVHAFLFNINVAEWGDSYRILRASESLKIGFYPLDEKRPPLFSMILATQPNFLDQITYGRSVLLVFSSASFLIFFLLLRKYVKDEKWIFWGMLALLFNNVFLYWSLRIMTDVPFSFFVLLAVYLFGERGKSKLWLRFFTLGLVCGFAILTRFEGYLLAAAIVGAIFLEDLKLRLRKGLKINIQSILVKAKNTIPFFISLTFVVGPYLYFRNPFSSSYLDEPSGRKYDFIMLATYLSSLLSIFGLLSAFYVIFANIKNLKKIFTQNLALSIFVILELVLILFWPAAVPRLFVPIIPFLLIFLVSSLQVYFDQPAKNIKVALLINLMVLGIYTVGQYLIKLQFLILDKNIFAINLVLQLSVIWCLVQKKFKHFAVISVLAMSLWSFSIINMHKDIFISVKNAAEYAAKNFTGNVAYNDVSSVSEWYLNYQYKRAEMRGFYYNTEKKQYLNQDALKKAGIDYLLITNEHNTTMTLDLNKRPFLDELKVFEYTVNGQEFVTRLVKVL